MSRIAIITGCNGQDGSYLSELLLSMEYKVHGLIRRSSVDNTERISHLLCNPKFNLVEGDVMDATGIHKLVSSIRPNEIYHLAAQSHVGTSFDQPLTSMDITCGGTISVLEAIRQVDCNIRMYNAASSEMYGDMKVTPQAESGPFDPISPYAIAKLAGFNFVRLYRKAYQMFASNGILFNHESPRRGDNFVTRKITRYVAKLKNMMANSDKVMTHPLELGNIDSKRDWGDARDYVRGMYMMLQHDKPDDFVLATGETRTVREFLDVAFGYIGIKDWNNFVLVSNKHMRPADVTILHGDAAKAKIELGWEPTISFDKMVMDMIDNDAILVRK